EGWGGREGEGVAGAEQARVTAYVVVGLAGGTRLQARQDADSGHFRIVRAALEVGLPGDAGDRAARHPDGAVAVAGDVDPARPAQRRALAHHVRGSYPA